MKSIFSFFFLFLSFYFPFLGTDKVAQSTIRDKIQILADDTVAIETRIGSLLEVLIQKPNLDPLEITDYIFPFYQKLIEKQIKNLNGDNYYCDLALLQQIGRKLDIQEWKQSYVDLNKMRQKLYEYFPAFIAFLSYDQVKEHVFPLIDQELQHIDYNVETIYRGTHSGGSQPAECRIIGPQKQLNSIDAIFKKYKNEIAFDDQKKLSLQIFQLIQIHKNEELESACSRSPIDSSDGSGISIIGIYFPYLCAEERRQVFDDLVAFILEHKPNLFMNQRVSVFSSMIDSLILTNQDKDNLFEIGKQYLKHFETSGNSFDMSNSWPIYSFFLSIFEQSHLSYTKEQLDFLNVLANMPFDAYSNPQLRFIIKMLSLSEINILEKQEFWQKVFNAFDDNPGHRYDLVEIVARLVDLNSNEGKALLDKLRIADNITNASKLGLFEGKFSNVTMHIERLEIYNECIDFIKDANHNMLERFAALRGFLKNPHLTDINQTDFEYFFLFLSDERFDICDRCLLMKNLLRKYSKKLSREQLENLYDVLAFLDTKGQYFNELSDELFKLLNQKGGLDLGLTKSKKYSPLYELYKMWEPWQDAEKNIEQLLFDVLPDEFTFNMALEEATEAIEDHEDSDEASTALKQLELIKISFVDTHTYHNNVHKIFKHICYRILTHDDRQKLETKLIKNLALMYNNRIKNQTIRLLKVLDGIYSDIIFTPDRTLEENLDNLFAKEIPSEFIDDDVIEDTQEIFCNFFEESCPDFKVVRYVINQHCYDHSTTTIDGVTYALNFVGFGTKRRITTEEQMHFSNLTQLLEKIKKIRKDQNRFDNRLFLDIVKRVYLRIVDHENYIELFKKLKDSFDPRHDYIDNRRHEKILLKTLEGFYPDIRFPYNTKFEQSFSLLFSDVLPEHFTIDFAFKEAEKLCQSQDGSQGDIDISLQVLDTIKKDHELYHKQRLQEIFRRVYHRISNNEHKEVLQKILFEELVYNYDNCSSNEKTIMGVLSRFDPEIIVPIYLKKEFFNAVKARLLSRIKSFEDEKQEKFFDLLAKSQKDRKADDQLLLEQFLDQELPAIAKELEDEYRNPAKADDPLTENCFKNYLKGAIALFLNLVDHDPFAHMG